MFGVIFIQGYWINKSYQINKEQLLKELNLALEKSVKKELNDRMTGQAKMVLSGNNTSVVFIGKERKTDMKIDSLLQDIFNDKISKREKNIIIEYKNRFGDYSPTDLLKYVYQNYPMYIENSEFEK